MAEYIDLIDLINNSNLQARVQVAISIEADTFMRAATPSANEIQWANQVLSEPKLEAKKALVSILATNNTLTTTQILGASDGNIQTQVSQIVPKLVDALAGA